MFKTSHTYKVSLDTYMGDLFPKGLPVNAFINKGRCAIRGTSQEMEDESRCTIIVVPSKSILIDKFTSERIKDRPDLIVYGDVKIKGVVEAMKDSGLGFKIMTTPEGIWKIIEAATQLGRLKEVYKDWFLLLDECHTFISDAYRKNILLPFKYFWNFDKKSIISATPYYFSDERFYTLDLHEVTFTEKLGKITLVEAISVDGTLNYLLKNASQAQGNVHIFYNSVTAIRNAVSRAGLQDCNIFCANSNDKDNSNLEKLGEMKKFFVDQPKKGLYKKINFYTCKYFEGWDLHDDNATIILVTDCYKPHTKIGVADKGKQAVGRLRSKAEQIIHLTNHKRKSPMTTLEEFRREYRKEAESLIETENRIRTSKFGKFKGNEMLHKFADIVESTKLVILNLNKLDQQINESANNEIYNNISFIKEAWEGSFFEVELRSSDIKLESETSIKRKSAAKQLEEDYLALEQFKEQQSDGRWFYFGETVEEEIKRRNPLAHQAFNLLDKSTLETLEWNVKKVERSVITSGNQTAEVKLLRMMKRIFKKDCTYTNSFIKEKLQQLYNELDLTDLKTGKIKAALPSQLGGENRFKVKKTKKKNSDGEMEHAYKIIDHKLLLKVTD